MIGLDQVPNVIQACRLMCSLVFVVVPTWIIQTHSRTLKQTWFLADKTDVLTQPLEIQGFHVTPINQNSSMRGSGSCGIVGSIRSIFGTSWSW